MPRLGLVGYSNSGKTTLFNALTGLEAPTAAHPYTTTQPKLGVAIVPDEKLEEVARLEGSAKVVHSNLELIDLPASGHHGGGPGGGLATAHLGRLKEVDALVAVLRAFDDPSVPDGGHGFDPAAQAEELSLEMLVTDSEQFERRRERLAKEASADPTKGVEAAVIGEAADLLAKGTALRNRAWEGEAPRILHEAAPLTLKPVVWVINVSEDEAAAPSRIAALDTKDAVITISAKIEEEGARLSFEDRRELFEGLGLGEGALATMVRAVYSALGLISFYTLGQREAHAWTVRQGTTALEAAGRIHSDFERGFIRAEVATIDQVIEAGGWHGAKHAGKVRIEGRGYTMGDGDVMLVRFSL